MCGICGIWEYGGSAGRVELSLVESMRDSMTHRGPDDEGASIFDEGRLGLGFRRLSIIDLSPAGNQPMHGCDDRTWLVFNGEIYNHAALRKQLEPRGHKYHSQTDSETILHLYEEHGLDFVNELEGDFGIALWDAERQQLVLARDRIGVKPLYFFHDGGRFIFASEIKAILKHPAVTPELDEESLYHYLTFLTTPAPATLFRKIQKLPAGHMLVVKRDGAIDLKQYWDAPPPSEAKDNRTEAEHSDEILRLLRESIGKRMMSDVPFGVFLSGGVDSSANVALMSELMSQPVRTYTVGFEEAHELNELDSAREIANRFKTDHHEVIIGQREMQQFLPELIYHQDEPVADPVSVPLYYVAKLARETGTIVVQVGEGADEIFAGYDWFRKYLRINDLFWRHAEKLPLALRHSLAAMTQPLMDASFNKRTGRELVRRLGAGESLFWGGAIVFDEDLKRRVLSGNAPQRLSSFDPVRQHLEHIAELRPESDFATRMSYLELKLRLPELLLMRVDKMTMATSVEARVPFLDHHLVEYAMNLPVDLKIKGETGKYILKRALEKVLPADLLYRRKRGFGAPIREWFRGESASALEGMILNSSIRHRELFDYAFVRKLIDEHRRGARDWSFHLWALLNVSLWYDRWIDPGQ